MSGFVPPTDEMVDVQCALNDDVRKNGLLQGDDGTEPRIVDHYVYPRSAARDFVLMKEAMAGLGFVVRETNDGTGLILSRNDATAGRKFDVLTATVDVMMRDSDWQYDGWEAPIVRKGGRR
ncbi:MAG: hypothetical protein JSS08_11715 [Proteobacteria bacterium]|nr:hypothetical protein [Pseudomonadota bacterium]